MLKIFNISDLHIEKRAANAFDKSILEGYGIDVAVFAGDIDRADKVVDTIASMVPAEIPYILFVAGNHEYHDVGKSLVECNAIMATDAELWNLKKQGKQRMFFLDNNSVDIIKGGVVYRFIGATMWGNEEKYSSTDTNDFKQIVGFTPETVRSEYGTTMRYFREQFNAARRENLMRDVVPVIITHHLPFLDLQPEEWRQDLFPSPFSGDAEEVLKFGDPAIWYYGHSHGGINRKQGDVMFLTAPVGKHIEKPNRLPFITTLDGYDINRIETLESLI